MLKKTIKESLQKTLTKRVMFVMEITKKVDQNIINNNEETMIYNHIMVHYIFSLSFVLVLLY